uniref:CSON009715 protein n=1 Tax=Culicoides sonorensis TaxID=179676 RepID=A0A336LXQ2_CULSO
MCGIFCQISNQQTAQSHKNGETFKQIIELLKRRGPDSFQENEIDGISFVGTVLHHQGTKPTKQPVINEKYVLLFNGDLFMNLDLADGRSDTDYLASMINEIQTEHDLYCLLGSLKGPYSLIYYNRGMEKLYFARDPMGRNSLLIGSVHGELVISSVCSYDLAESFMEVPPIGLYCFNINTNELSVVTWYDTNSHSFYQQQINLLLEKVKKPVEINQQEKIHLNWLKPIQIVDFNLNQFKEPFLLNEIHEEINTACDTFLNLLSKSVEERVTLTRNYCKACSISVRCNHCRIGILFSGGLDCSILAKLADIHIPRDQPIDLINVAFEKVKRKPNPRQTNKEKDVIREQVPIDWNVPDRLTAHQTFNELKKICPDRQWKLVEVNVTRNELENELSTRLRNLISPSKNILDESLGAALWFAARGKGFIDTKPYDSTCRVLLLGSGADELFAGYSRHRNAYKRAIPGQSELSLMEELELDWIRLPNRNLARDDRVISDHSITPRTPYLQEDLIQFIRSMKTNQRCNLQLESGIGDKLFLRICAFKLGLSECSLFKKRALQFGSRVADSRQKADNVSTYFQD